MTEDPAERSPEPTESAASREVTRGAGPAGSRLRRSFSAEVVDDIMRDVVPVITWAKFNANPLVNLNEQLMKQQKWLSSLVGAGIVPNDLSTNPASVIASGLKPFAEMQKSLRGSSETDFFSGVAAQQRRLIDAVGPQVATSIWSHFANALKPATDWQKSLLNAASVGSWLGPAFDSDWFNRLMSPLTPGALDGFRRLLESARPKNWAEVDTEQAQSLVAAGWPIIWVPRSDLVTALIVAPDDASRREILLEHSDDIIDDVGNAIGDLKSEQLAFLGGLAMQAVSCARLGEFGAAQATATAVADTAIRKFWKLNAREVRALGRPDFDDVPIRSLPRALCGAILARVFEQFFVERGDPEPDSYNRHASIHGASEKQYTTVNALLGLMTAASLLCQVDHEVSAKRDRSEAPAVAAASARSSQTPLRR